MSVNTCFGGMLQGVYGFIHEFQERCLEKFLKDFLGVPT